MYEADGALYSSYPYRRGRYHAISLGHVLVHSKNARNEEVCWLARKNKGDPGRRAEASCRYQSVFY